MDTPKNLLAPPGSVNKNLLAPQGVSIRAYLAPSRGLDKNLLAPPKCELHAVLHILKLKLKHCKLPKHVADTFANLCLLLSVLTCHWQLLHGYSHCNRVFSTIRFINLVKK